MKPPLADELTKVGYIFTDDSAIWAVQNALWDMGERTYLSTVLLDGPPGVGKTFLAKTVASYLRASFVYYQCVTGTGKSEMIFDRDPADNNRLIEGILPRAIAASLTGPTVLLIDEIDKVEPSVESFLLGMISDNMLSVPQIGDLSANTKNFIIFITKNDARDATDPLMRRCRVVHMKWPSVETELRILKQAVPGAPSKLLEVLIEWANPLRLNAFVTKKPSSPELIRLAQDLMVMVQHDQSKIVMGRYVINGLLPKMTDQEHIKVTPVYLGTVVAESFSSM